MSFDQSIRRTIATVYVSPPGHKGLFAEEDKPTAFSKVFSEVQLKAITVVVEDLLEGVMKDHVGALQLEKGHRSTVPSK